MINTFSVSGQCSLSHSCCTDRKETSNFGYKIIFEYVFIYKSICLSCENSIKDGCKNACMYKCTQTCLTEQTSVHIRSCMLRSAFSLGSNLQFIYE